LHGIIFTIPNNTPTWLIDRNGSNSCMVSRIFNRFVHLFVLSCLGSLPFELIMVVLLQCCCGDNKTTNCISMNTRPNWTYDIWVSLSIRIERVSVTSLLIETDLKLRQVYYYIILRTSFQSIFQITQCNKKVRSREREDCYP
jgi:hypothetical protein